MAGPWLLHQGLPGIHLARSLVADFEVADTLVAGVQGQLSLVPTFLADKELLL